MSSTRHDASGRANGRFGPRLCKNASAGRGAEKSTAQIALYSTIVTYGGVRGPLKSFPKCVFTRPYMDTARFAKLILV